MANSDSGRGRAALTIFFLVAALGAVAAWAYLRRPPIARPTGDVSAPADFGGMVHAASLADLAKAAEGHALNTMSLALDLGRREAQPAVAIGDTLRVVASSGEPARCAVYHRNGRGEFHLFHPEKGDAFALSASQRWDSGPLRVTEPTGAEFFLLVCRSEGTAALNLHDLLEGPQAEWRRSIGAVRADYDVR